MSPQEQRAIARQRSAATLRDLAGAALASQREAGTTDVPYLVAVEEGAALALAAGAALAKHLEPPDCVAQVERAHQVLREALRDELAQSGAILDTDAVELLNALADHLEQVERLRYHSTENGGEWKRLDSATGKDSHGQA